MAKPKRRHPIQTIGLEKYPFLLKHEFKEGDVVVLNKGKGHEIRMLKDLIRNHRKIRRCINEEKGIYKKERFGDGTRKGIWREYHLIADNEGVIIGSSPIYGLPTHSISNVCYLVGGLGFGGLSYEYDVCFVMTEYDKTRDLLNKVCMIWTLWEGAIAKVVDKGVSDNS